MRDANATAALVTDEPPGIVTHRDLAEEARRGERKVRLVECLERWEVGGQVGCNELINVLGGTQVFELVRTKITQHSGGRQVITDQFLAHA